MSVGRLVEVRVGKGWRFGRVVEERSGVWRVALRNGRIVEVGGEDLRFVKMSVGYRSGRSQDLPLSLR